MWGFVQQITKLQKEQEYCAFDARLKHLNNGCHALQPTHILDFDTPHLLDKALIVTISHSPLALSEAPGYTHCSLCLSVSASWHRLESCIGCSSSQSTHPNRHQNGRQSSFAYIDSSSQNKQPTYVYTCRGGATKL